MTHNEKTAIIEAVKILYNRIKKRKLRGGGRGGGGNNCNRNIDR